MLVPINSGSFLLTHTNTAYNTGNRIKHDMNLLTKNCIGRSFYTSSICLYSEIPYLEVKHAKNQATICVYILYVQLTIEQSNGSPLTFIWRRQGLCNVLRKEMLPFARRCWKSWNGYGFNVVQKKGQQFGSDMHLS